MCRQINSGKTLEEIIQEKSLRQDLFDKYIQVIQEDTHEERRAYAPELASYAAEILAGLGAEVDLTPSQEDVARCSLRRIAVVYLQPREETLIKEFKRKGGEHPRSVGSRSRHYEEEYPRSRSPFGDSRRPRDEGEARRTRDGSSTQLRWQLPPPRDREKHSRVAALRHEDSDSAEEVETTRAAVIESGKGSQASSNDRPRYKFVEFKKLLSMVDNEHAKQAWPDNAKFSKVCQDFIIRPLDKQNQIWAEPGRHVQVLLLEKSTS